MARDRRKARRVRTPGFYVFRRKESRAATSAATTQQATTELRAMLGREQPKAQIDTLVEISDADDGSVCRSTFTWKLRRAR